VPVVLAVFLFLCGFLSVLSGFSVAEARLGLLKCFMIKIAAAAVLRGLLKRFAELVSLIETRYFNFKSALPDSIF
jgi:hypothetical protein